MPASIGYSFDDSRLSRVLDGLAGEVDASKGPMRDAMRQAAARYMGFIRRRFVNAARHDGTWPDLALSTKLRRARGTKAGRSRFNRQLKRALPGEARRRVDAIRDVIASMSFEILRDKGFLLNSLTQGNPGYFEEIGAESIKVGTANRIAKYHQDGNPPRMPKREIIVAPDERTTAAMNSDIARGLQRVLQAVQSHG